MTVVTTTPAGDSKRVDAALRAYALADRYGDAAEPIHLTGIQALVRVLLERQRRDRRDGRATSIYVSGYEGSPLAGYDIELTRHRKLLTEHRIIHQPGLNEEIAATAVSGTQLAGNLRLSAVDGVTGVWYGKAPGLDRATDALRHANIVGTSGTGGAIALVGDDPGAKSSSVPCSSEFALADLAMPTFAPADPAEVLQFGMHASELSRACGLWSALKIATAVADGSQTVVHSDWHPADLADLTPGLSAYQHQPSARLLGAELLALERSLFEVRLPTALEYIRRSQVNTIANGGAATIGIVAAGKTYLDVVTALRMLGITTEQLADNGIRLLKLGAVYPLDGQIVTEFARGLSEVVVVEDKRSFLEDAVKAVLYGRANSPRVVGKQAPSGDVLFSAAGEHDAVAVATGLASRLSEVLDLPTARNWRAPRLSRARVNLSLTPKRQPYFCSGCPHNSSTTAPTDSPVGAGIGCHAMVLFMSTDQVGEITGLCQMGGEGAHWIGMSPFVEQNHFVQNIGDGTFAHSGSLAIRAAVAAGVNVTFRLLRNSAVAMTGGQQAVGERSLRQLVDLLYSEGVAKVVVTSPEPKFLSRSVPRGTEVAHRDDIDAVQERLAAMSGVTVLIHDQECAAEKRRKRRRGTAPTPSTKVFINERVCEGCGDCGRASNCLSVQPVDTEYGRKTRIDQSTCNLDFSCLAGDCPSFLTVTVPDSDSRHQRQTSLPLKEFGPIPEPEIARASSSYSIRITGVGGTGVVTVAQTLAVAALLDGKYVRGLDQTGLAQKGGAVVSDLTISDCDEPAAAKIADGAADLYLSCDVLVGADENYLRAVAPDRTLAVVSTSEVPTGQMVSDPAVTFPPTASLTATFETSCARSIYLDALALSRTVLGSDQQANIIAVGAAYQAGALPISHAALQRAIELNGMDVDENLAAFALGRAHVAGTIDLSTENDTREANLALQIADHPSGLTASKLLLKLTGIEPDSPAGQLAIQRAAELIDYQDKDYACRYLRMLERVSSAEKHLGGDELTASVARSLFSLMAYKDEYEVARLSVRPELRDEIRAQFGPKASFRYRLHPPALRAMGMQRKIALGRWFDPIFRLLYTMRRLRGTVFDPFGIARIRRIERQLIDEYCAVVDRLLDSLTASNRAAAVEVSALPALIRGYEHIKLANIETYRLELQKTMYRFLSHRDGDGAQV